MARRITALEWLQIVPIVVILLWLIAYPIAYVASGNTARFTVKQTEYVVRNGQGRYLIFTEGGEVLENTDTILYGKWDSSDLQSNLEEGKTYDARVAGWRWPFFSCYRNVVSLEEVKRD